MTSLATKDWYLKWSSIGIATITRPSDPMRSMKASGQIRIVRIRNVPAQIPASEVARIANLSAFFGDGIECEWSQLGQGKIVRL